MNVSKFDFRVVSCVLKGITDSTIFATQQQPRFSERVSGVNPDSEHRDRETNTTVTQVRVYIPIAHAYAHEWTLSTLTDVSRSSLMYLHDGSLPNKLVAVDIGSRGFHIWQNYVNAMDLLRALFRLSTSHGTGTPSPAEKEANRTLALHARSGVLHIATSETPLFVSTITLDIMDARSVVHRNATMQLIAFIIRRVSLSVQSLW